MQNTPPQKGFIYNGHFSVSETDNVTEFSYSFNFSIINESLEGLMDCMDVKDKNKEIIELLTHMFVEDLKKYLEKSH